MTQPQKQPVRPLYLHLGLSAPCAGLWMCIQRMYYVRNHIETWSEAACSLGKLQSK